MRNSILLTLFLLWCVSIEAQVIPKDVPDPSGACFGGWVRFINSFRQTVDVRYLEETNHSNGVSKTIRLAAGADAVMGCKQSRDGTGIGPYRTFSIQSVKDLSGRNLAATNPPPAGATPVVAAPPPLPPPYDKAWPPTWFDPNNKGYGSYPRPIDTDFAVGKVCNTNMSISVPSGKRAGEKLAVEFKMGPSGLSGPWANIFSSGEVDWGDGSPRTGFDLIFSEYKPFQRLAAFNQVREHVYSEPGTYHVSAFMGGDFKDTVHGSWRCNAQRWEDITILK